MPVSGRDGKQRSNKKRKHEGENDKIVSTQPVKKAKANDARSNNATVRESAGQLDGNTATGQSALSVTERSERKQRKQERRAQERAQKVTLATPTTNGDASTASQKRSHGTASNDSPKARHSKRRKKPQERIEDQPLHAEPEVKQEDVAPGGMPNGLSLELTKGRRKKDRRAAREARKAIKREQDFDSKGVVQLDTANSPSKHPAWTLSSPFGGCFLDHDPIFVEDGFGNEALISASRGEVQVLSTKTSLVSHTHAAPDGTAVMAYATDPVERGLLYVSYSNGTIATLDIDNDFKVRNTSNVGGITVAISLAPPLRNGNIPMYRLCHLGGSQYGVATQDVVLYTTRHPLQSMLILGDSRYIVCQGSSVIVLGRLRGNNIDGTSFDWDEVPLSWNSTSFDAQLTQLQPGSKKSKSQKFGVRLALGNANGQIHLYEDISHISNRLGAETTPSPRVLHWHREAVSSVKFSRDGNYLISGGKETVLVIWQLETGKKQYLPHLTSEIERIVVNPAGDRYALQMGDNSIMVLSTSELKPVAHFAGLQYAPSNDALASKAKETPMGAFVGVLHPRNTNQLVLTVPSTRPKSDHDINSRPFLQTFDIRHSRHISRQALARNNVTDFNLGPEKTPIVTPDVEHLAISHDGTWMATVDEWMPSAFDLEHLGTDLSNIEEGPSKRREVYLKFWLWDEKEELWTLSTRVDAPHARKGNQNLGAGKVFALVTNPATDCFTTVGEDLCVRLWRPKRGRQDDNRLQWSCKWTVQLPDEVDHQLDGIEGFDVLKDVCVSFSGDGSLVAVSLYTRGYVQQTTPIVHFIDTATGTIAHTKPGLAKNEICALGFLERYFIVVSQPAVYVWDLVEDTLMYSVSLKTSPEAQRRTAVPPMLSIDNDASTFAVAIDRKRIEVYRPRHPKRIYKEEFETRIDGILSGKGRRGYVLVFADATVRTVSQAGGTSQLRPRFELGEPTQAIEAKPEIDEAGDTSVDVAAVPTDLLKDKSTSSAERSRFGEVDRPVVRPEQLAGIFDAGQSYAMPPVKDMFQAVVGLFAKKPAQIVATAV